MSSAYVVSNNGLSTLAGTISTSSQTSISLQSGHGARFPSPTGGDYTLVTLENAAGTIEIVSIVGRSTDTLTVGVAGSAAANAAGRGMEGTTATTWAIGDIVEGRATAAILKRGGNAKTALELAAAGGAALVGNTPAGSISAITVQAALNELDTEKAALAGSASQAFSMSTAAAGTNTTQGATTAFVFGMRTKVTSHSRAINGATGAVTYTGVGFTPRKVTAYARIAGTLSGSVGQASAGGMVCSATNVNAVYDSVTAASFMIASDPAASQKTQSATLTSFNSDGGVFQWTNAGSPAAGTAITLILVWEE